ncbi:alkaline phosphatase family protein [Sphingomonas sp.]|uniref:alkaline phosphatase family protein n=1 Tax=Sphingomonas sp. TaxID=28214 RepID=UPI003B3AC4A9
MVRARIRVAATLLAAATGMISAAEAAPPRPKLVVAIAIDQFSAELYERYRPSFTGGLKRLGEGIAFTGYQSHAATETCPGHSTILTGRHPAATGIIANTWFDTKRGTNVYCVAVPGAADPDARGPQNLRVSTFGDWLKQAQPKARVVSISGKDRAAIMLGGHKADAVYWWKDGVGFTTSAYAGPATAAVTAPAAVFDHALFARWKANPPQLWPTEVPAACRALEQPHVFGKLAISGTIPPDLARTAEEGDFLNSAQFKDQLHISPIFDPMTLDFVDETIDRLKLGHGPATDLLAVSLSSTDYIGHRYGNGGAEMCVQMHALDQALGAFLAKLDRLGVPYVVALTADHGGNDAAERVVEHGIKAERIDPAAFVKALNDALQAQLGLTSKPIVGDDPQQLTINVGPDPALRARVRDAAVAWLKQRPEVAAVFTADQTAAAVPPRGKTPDQLTVLERFHESYDKERSGDIQVELSEHASIGMPRRPGDNVAGHGSPWDYDRRVPILFWWPGIAAEPRADPIETVDIAPTLAAIVKVPTPQVDGKCLASVAERCR